MHIYQKSEQKEKRNVDQLGYYKELITGEIDYLDFQQFGLQCTKNLINFDVWEEVNLIYFKEICNQEFFNRIKDIQGPHAKSPGYLNNIYIWQDVDVLDYCSKTKKFKVRVIGQNQIKEIVKLALLFNDENKEQFFQRLFMAKNLQNRSQNDLRYLKYIQSIDKNITCKMPQQTKDNISKKVQIKYNHQTRQINEEIIQITDNYNLYMNKCVVLKEMLQKENEVKFKTLRIDLKTINKYIPFYGTINGQVTQYQYNFKPYQEIVFFYQKVNQKSYKQAQISCFNIRLNELQELYI